MSPLVEARQLTASAYLPKRNQAIGKLETVTDLLPADALAYAGRFTTPVEGHLREVADWTQEKSAAPMMMSGLAEARLLQALIVAGGAEHMLEIGTFTGFGTLMMAAAQGTSGHLITLEVDEETAATARRHIEDSPHREQIELVVGDALEGLERLDGPFDLVYIDAWKSDYPAYYEAVVPKLAERGVIVADNLFRGGAALDTSATDQNSVGIREFASQVQRDERVHNVLLTVGDGVMLAWWRPAGER